MFNSLTDTFHRIFATFSKEKYFTEESIKEAVKQVRLALLDADVNFKVVSSLVKNIKDKVIGDLVEKGIKATDAFIEIVHQELVRLMGEDEAQLDFKKKQTKILLCGLQGSGKTTTCAKLAAFIQEGEKKSVSLVALDLKRAAAVEQLQILAKEIHIPVFSVQGEVSPLAVAKKSLSLDTDVVIYDTAGRQNIDEELMDELLSLKEILSPDYIFFVANCASGQRVVEIAAAFDEKIQITGTILTMLDGSARAGAAISIKEVTKRPLFFEGVGEKINDFQVFNPKSMADRILGMGDVINLVKKMKKEISEEESLAMEEKIKKASFNYNDFLKQMKMLKKMGSFKGLMKMMPKMGGEPFDFSEGEAELKRCEAVIFSMTPKEREGKDEMTMGRRKRVAKGSGVALGEVNKMIKKFGQMKEKMQQFSAMQKNFSPEEEKKMASLKKKPHFDRFFS
jgi:signal recognition particle subunit SRP54